MKDQITPHEGTESSFTNFKNLNVLLLVDGEDPAFASAVGLDTVTDLQTEGYKVEPVATGKKGGSIEVVVLLSQALTFAKVHHAAISEITQDLSALTSIFAGLLPIYKAAFKAITRRTGSDEVATTTLKIVTEIDGHPVTVEATDLKEAEAALNLAKRFHSQHPHIAQSSSGKRNIKTHVQVARSSKKKLRRS